MAKSCEPGIYNVQLNLGVIYDEGLGVPKNAAKAMEWYRKAAELGNAEAQFNLGGVYRDGKGVPKDAAKAAEWFQKAAAQGLAEAQYWLGRMYHFGKGVPKDSVKAAQWYQKAAAQGLPGFKAFHRRPHRLAFRPAGQPIFGRHFSGQRQQGETSRRSLVLPLASFGAKLGKTFDPF